ncbi:MAG TPA: phenylacetate--CoA ligase [Solirubrobacteraceae bacterium]|jgi:phenylacetate-CoA ligase|nr:phenylacetate--CoA ligase [Solirubrobacteraceae bacterium]
MPPTAASEQSPIRDPAEALGRDRLHALQLERLRRTVALVLRAQPRGAELLARAGIASADDVRSLADLARIPFMQKSDLRESYPFGLLAVPRTELVRVHASSGTHGKPTVVGYTRGDMENWTELVARNMTMAGVKPGMLIHNANGYGLLTGGFGYHHGAERLGATVLPVSGGFTARQAMLLADLHPEVLVSTPSYALAIAAAVRDAGVDPLTLGLRLGLFGGEASTPRLREQIERQLGLKAVDSYGLSEMCGPGVSNECLQERDGLHVHEDHFLVEVVDPQDGRVLEPGAQGELVFTTLTKEALPLIRYRTGDLAAISIEPCPCGRTTARILDLRGRRDDMLTIRGVNVHPSNVEHLLLGIDGITPHYRLVAEREGPMDELTVECEVEGDGDPAELSARVAALLREQMGLRIGVVIVDPGTLPRSDGKAVRVLDRRDL